MYYGAEGNTPQEKINALRREMYAENKDEINERKRELYAIRKPKNAENTIEKNIRSDIIQSTYQEQKKIRTDIPKMYDGDFSDYLSLDLAENESSALLTLNRLSKENNYEYGIAIIDGVVGKTFTSNDVNRVQVPEELLLQKVKIYHSHTNHTPPSIPDLRFLLNKNVEEIGVISINGDTYTVTVGDGANIGLEEFDRVAESIRAEVTNTIMDDYDDFFEWTETERNYIASKETFFRVVQHFGFRAKGGNIL